MPIETKFDNLLFLPLLNARDALITLEVLSYGIVGKNRTINVQIYKNVYRSCDAFNFRKELLFQFTHQMFLDLAIVLQTPDEILQLVVKEILRRLASNHYDVKKLSRGEQWLDAAILLYCIPQNSWKQEFLQYVIWTKKEIMQWRLAIGQKLIQSTG